MGTSSSLERFKSTVDEQILNRDEQRPRTDRDKQYIDNKLDHFYTALTKAAQTHIPTIRFKTLPHPKQSPTLSLLQWQYQHQCTLAQYQGTWTPELKTNIGDIRIKIRDESKRLYDECWRNKIDKLELKKNDPKDFWKQIKQLSGTPTLHIPYIIQNNTKLHSNQDKEQAFRSHWQTTFSITPEENKNFDQDHERIIINQVNTIANTITHYHTVDMKRLNPDECLKKPITLTEVKTKIQYMKNKAPGTSKINKTMLTQLTDTALNYLTKIYNETFSMGYFPDRFKTAEIIFIPNRCFKLQTNFTTRGTWKNIRENTKRQTIQTPPGKQLNK